MMKIIPQNYKKRTQFLHVMTMGGLLCLVIGLFLMFRQAKQVEMLTRQYQVDSVNVIIDYVDIVLNNEFNNVEAPLRFMDNNPMVLEHEKEAVETGDYETLREHVELTMLNSSALVKYYYVSAGDRYLCGNIPADAVGEMRFLSGTPQDGLGFVQVGDELYMSVGSTSDYGLSYVVLMDFKLYFDAFYTDEVRRENWIVLYEEENHIFFQNHDNQPYMVTADVEELEQRQDGYTIIADFAEKQEQGYEYYDYRNYDGEDVSNCLCVKPASLTRNGCLTIGVAQGLSMMQSLLAQSYSLLPSVLISAFGLLVMIAGLIFMMSERKENAQRFLALETENRLMETRNKLTAQQMELMSVKQRLSLQQMEPHFLYNALASIREIVLDDPKYASDLIYDFTTHLRACIKAVSGADNIPFSKELENVRAYVNIEKMRYGDKLTVVYDIRCEEFPIVPLTVQPLIENAVKHGIYPRGKAGGTVTLTSEETEDEYRITVRDDGVGFDYEQVKREIAGGKRDSTALSSLIFRLDTIMGASVDIHSEIGKGSEFVIRISKNNIKQHDATQNNTGGY